MPDMGPIAMNAWLFRTRETTALGLCPNGSRHFYSDRDVTYSRQLQRRDDTYLGPRKRPQAWEPLPPVAASPSREDRRPAILLSFRTATSPGAVRGAEGRYSPTHRMAEFPHAQNIR